jgi:hypothetical protein
MSNQKKIPGYDLELKTEKLISENGWETKSGVNYFDNEEEKNREIDIICSQKMSGLNPRGEKIALIVECKYLGSDQYVVYSRNNPKDRSAYFTDGYNTEEIFNDNGNYHYLSTEKVVRNIDKTDNKRNNLYKSIMQSIKAMMSLREGRQILNTKGLFYPVVVYRGEDVIFDEDGNKLKNFLYYCNYQWKNQEDGSIINRNIYVDVIHETALENYLNIFKKEKNYLDFYKNKQQRFKEMRRKKVGGNKDYI